ncbi:MAG: site-specific DNA-methyltransferase [Aphanocapsa sp. GSE-SYN-MK-11-07L]|jgi:hypothetical protein|nr:site-specific DNA-methyltransferase [Aphanocapsa sp. GSE-SYN-MK-11-07L]
MPELDYSNPELNQVKAGDRAAHDWYRFVLSYPPHLVQSYLQKFGVEPTQQVLDPFCGTGTTVVECKKLGIPSVGVEANPIAWFAGSTKLDWSPDPAQLIASAHQIAELTEPLLRQHPLRTLPADSQQIMLKNSISPLPLHKTLVLLEQIDRLATYPNHHRLALAKAAVSASNLRFGPEVGLGKPKQDAPVLAAWLQEISAMAEDLRQLQPLKSTSAKIHHADSRQLLQVLEPASIDAIITSPPYPNEKDYTRTTRLESVLLGLIQSKAELRALKQGLMRSNTRNVYKADTDDGWVAKHPEIQRLAAEIEARRIELGKTSGFERVYARATQLYFGGMTKHLADLRPILRPGAQLAYVVGDQASYLRVLIRTGQLLASLAEALGYEVVEIDLFRTRLATASQDQLREEVVVLRWPGKMPIWKYPYA